MPLTFSPVYGGPWIDANVEPRPKQLVLFCHLSSRRARCPYPHYNEFVAQTIVHGLRPTYPEGLLVATK